MKKILATLFFLIVIASAIINTAIASGALVIYEDGSYTIASGCIPFAICND